MKLLSKITLPYQLLIALILGLFFGYFVPGLDKLYALLGTLFINSLSMIVLPLIFPIVVTSVVSIFKQKSFGQILLKTFLYFFITTTLIIFIYLVAGYYLNFGSSVKGVGNVASLKGVASNIDIFSFLSNIVPANVFAAFGTNSLLSVIFFAIVLGLGLGAYGPEQSEPVLKLLKIVTGALYKITDFIIKLSAIGVFGIVAHDVNTVGADKLTSLLTFVIALYVGYAFLALVIFPIIATIFHVPFLQTVKETKNLLSLAFFSGSSSVVLPKLLEKLKQSGTSAAITDFVVPLGYTFNLQGAVVYLSIAVTFIANTYGIHVSFASLITITLLLTIISKTIATVPSGAIVVLLATASQLGIPKEGVALVFAVDFFANAGRTALNVLGNAIAAKSLDRVTVKATVPSHEIVTNRKLETNN